MMLYGCLAAPASGGDCAQALDAAPMRTRVHNPTVQMAKEGVIDRNLMRDTPIGVSCKRSGALDRALATVR